MKMAKADEKDMDAMANVAGILTDVDSGYYPRNIENPDENDDEPTFFDDEDPKHLKVFYDRIKACMDSSPGCVWRVIGGFHTLMHNDLVDPDKDYLDYHPKIKAALEAEV